MDTRIDFFRYPGKDGTQARFVVHFEDTDITVDTWQEALWVCQALKENPYVDYSEEQISRLLAQVMAADWLKGYVPQEQRH